MRVVLLIVGALVLALLIVQVGPGEIVDSLRRIGWGLIPMSGLYLGHQMLRASALRLSTVRSGAVAFRDALAVRFSGEAIQFLTSTGPFLAEPSKALLLARRGLTKTEGFAATIGEYLAYTFASAVMLLAATAYLATQLDEGALRNFVMALSVIAAVFLLVSAMAVWRRIYLIGGAVAYLRAVPLIGGSLQYAPEAVRHMEDLLLEILRERRRRLVVILVIEAAAAGVLVLELWWILVMSGVAAGFFRALVLESASKFTGLAFFFVPGQVGASEGVNLVMFRLLGLPGAAGVGVAIARRLRSALTAIAGLAMIALLSRDAPRA